MNIKNYIRNRIVGVLVLAQVLFSGCIENLPKPAATIKQKISAKTSAEEKNLEKIITLSTLDLKLKVPCNLNYYDDGFVPDVEAHLIKLYKVYNNKSELCKVYNKRYNRRKNSNPASISLGRCSAFYPAQFKSTQDALNHGALVSIHTYVLENSGVPLSFLRGHEETHVLMKLGKLDTLKNELEKSGIKTDELEKNPEEMICTIGGLYAWLHKGYPLNKGYLSIFVKTTCGEEAIKWMQKNSTYINDFNKN